MFLAAEIFIGGLFPSIVNVNDTYKDLKDRTTDELQTDINITDVTVTDGGAIYDLNISVYNTGSITLNTSSFTILIDGTQQQFICSEAYLYPEKNAFFTFDDLEGDGEKKLKVVTDNGIAEYSEYTVP